MSFSPVLAFKSWTIKGIVGLVLLVWVGPAVYRRLSRRVDQKYLEYQDHWEPRDAR